MLCMSIKVVQDPVDYDIIHFLHNFMEVDSKHEVDLTSYNSTSFGKPIQTQANVFERSLGMCVPVCMCLAKKREKKQQWH